MQVIGLRGQRLTARRQVTGTIKASSTRPASIRSKHYKALLGGCAACSQQWPCDAYLLADATENAERRAESNRFW
jgi:hypothetical protein